MNTLTTTPRMLPFDVRPFDRETWTSYTNRLLAANHCNDAHRAALLKPFIDGAGLDAEYAAWKKAIPALTKRTTLHLSIQTRDPNGKHTEEKPRWRPASWFIVPTRLACTLCSHGHVVEQIRHFDNIVCTRHSRWLGLWGAVTDQHSVGPEYVTAQRTFAKLCQKARINPGSYLYVTKAIGRALHPHLSVDVAEQHVFPRAVALLKTITGDPFAQKFFNPATQFSAAHQYLSSVVEDSLGHPEETVTRALWIYLRSTMQTIHEAIRREGQVNVQWKHDYLIRPHVAEGLVRYRGDLEPIDDYLNLTGDTLVSGVQLIAELSQLHTITETPTLRHFRCDKGHEFDYLLPTITHEQLVNTRYTPTCGHCTDRRVRPGDNDMQTRFPAIATQFDTYRNGGLSAADVTHSSRTKYTWTCEKGHSHMASPFKKTSGAYNCPVCSNRIIRSGVNCLITTHPEAAAMWAGGWNAGAYVYSINSGSEALASWWCKNEHVFSARPYEVAFGRRGCNLCQRERTIDPKKSLATTHPHLLPLWDAERNGGLTPEMVTHGERREVHWLCEKGHSHKSRLDKMTRGQKCPVCSSRKLRPTENSLLATEPVLSLEYHTYLNWKRPDEIFPSDHLLWWRCMAGRHEIQQTVQNRRQSRGCPQCEPELRILNRHEVA